MSQKPSEPSAEDLPDDALDKAQGGGKFLMKRAEQVGYEAQADLDQAVNLGMQSISKES